MTVDPASLETLISRRGLLQGAALAGIGSLLPQTGLTKTTPVGRQWHDFPSLPEGLSPRSRVAKGYRETVLLRWGDGILPDSPVFDFKNPTPEAQATQFGYNADYIALIPAGRTGQYHLCVNHETPSPILMFPPDSPLSPAQRGAIEQEAVGHSIVLVEADAQGIRLAASKSGNRRITATTPCRMGGIAMGSPRLRTKANPTGTRALGTLGNCAGGVTPWGTVLTCEENIDVFFTGTLPQGHPEQQNHRRMGVGRKTAFRNWAPADPRFDIGHEPNEPNRFGWVVEIDPANPGAPPVKRTSLGRFKHEGATVTRAKDGRIVVYMGDDEIFEYLYKYVSSQPWQPGHDGGSVLDEGTLYVARFEENGTLHWLPLLFGNDELTAANGFASQADVLIEARRAATLRGATPMDRPEGIAVHPHTGKVYVALTKNPARIQPNAANPRRRNINGHILELSPAHGDHAHTEAHWTVALLAGKKPGRKVWFSCPDNLAFSPDGTLWAATDGNPKVNKDSDGFYQILPDGQISRLYAAPGDSEVTGPCFTPDGQWLLLAIQHHDDRRSIAAMPTRWPDFSPDLPPRPGVVVIGRG